MAHEQNVLIKKYPKEGDPAKMHPMDEWAHRNRAWDMKTDSAIAGVRRRQNRSRWTFGMPNVTQERWDEIFGKKGEKHERSE
jgi:hypothetical protein